jgi:hypothetical protein
VIYRFGVKDFELPEYSDEEAEQKASLLHMFFALRRLVRTTIRYLLARKRNVLRFQMRK